jgi:hypothetical protein
MGLRRKKEQDRSVTALIRVLTHLGFRNLAHLAAPLRVSRRAASALRYATWPGPLVPSSVWSVR